MLRADGNYDVDAVSRETAISFEPDEFVAKQSFAEECDINTIVRRFGVGVQPVLNVRPPLEGDFTDAMDYRSALEAVMAADASFMSMPAEVRKRFSNDAAEFVAFCSDPANLDEMRKLGLALPVAVKATDGTVSS